MEIQNAEYQETLSLFGKGKNISEVKKNYLRALLGILKVVDQAFVYTVYLNRELLRLGENLYKNGKNSHAHLLGAAIFKQIDGDHPEREEFLGQASAVQDGLRTFFSDTLQEVRDLKDSSHIPLYIPEFKIQKITAQLDKTRNQRIKEMARVCGDFLRENAKRRNTPMSKRPSRLEAIPLDPSLFENIKVPDLHTSTNALSKLEAFAFAYTRVYSTIKELKDDLYGVYDYDAQTKKVSVCKVGAFAQTISALADLKSSYADYVKKRTQNFEPPLRNSIFNLEQHIGTLGKIRAYPSIRKAIPFCPPSFAAQKTPSDLQADLPSNLHK